MHELFDISSLLIKQIILFSWEMGTKRGDEERGKDVEGIERGEASDTCQPEYTN